MSMSLDAALRELCWRSGLVAARRIEDVWRGIEARRGARERRTHRVQTTTWDRPKVTVSGIAEQLTTALAQIERGDTRDAQILLDGYLEWACGAPPWPDEAQRERLTVALEALATSLQSQGCHIVTNIPVAEFERVSEANERLQKPLFVVEIRDLAAAGDIAEADRAPVAHRPVGATNFPEEPVVWRLGDTQIELLFADIFAKPLAERVNARVSSEQTDFILSAQRGTISGELRARGGEVLQQKLLAEVRRAGGKTSDGVPPTLPCPMVLETREKYTGRWFHAGIHDPIAARTREETFGDDLAAVEVCLREILTRIGAAEPGKRSVAVPLLGAGHFGLDSRVVAATTVRQVVAAARNLRPAPERVVIVFAPTDDGLAAFRTAVQTLLDESSAPGDYERLALGVPVLDAFEKRVAQSSASDHRSWLLCSFAELVIAYVHALLAAQRREPLPDPGDRGQWLATFGELRGRIRTLADTRLADGSDSESALSLWSEHVARFAHEQRRRLDALVEYRNRVAHGRDAPAPAEIRDAIVRATGGSRWRELASRVAPPVEGLEPWLRGQPVAEFLHRCNPDRTLYLDPVSGLVTERR